MKYEVMLSQFQVPFSAHRSSFPGHFSGDCQQAFPRFFQFMTNTSQGKSFNSATKIAVKLVRLPSFKVFVEILKKIQLLKVVKIYRRLYGWGHKLAPHTNACKFSQPCRAKSSLTYDGSLSNLEILVILRCSLHWFRRIFLNWLMSRVEKTTEGSIIVQD